MFLKHYEKLCAKAVSGDISESEKIKLDKWLKSSEKNQIYFNDLKDVWAGFEVNSIPKVPDIKNEWKTLNNILESEESSLIRNMKKVKMVPGETSRLSSNLAQLALTGVFFAAVFTLYFIFQPNKTPAEWRSLQTINNEQTDIQLADGSTVKLNSGSKIEFPSKFDGSFREVRLYGEAYFSIQKDAAHPFVVLTENAKTTVLGTKFNVFNRGAKTEVIVKEGTVKLSSLNQSGKAVNITKNQLSFVSSDNKVHSPENVDADYKLGWLEGKLVFNNTPLIEVKDKLIRFYDVPVKLETDRFDSSGLTGTFKKEKIDEVLAMICLTYNLKFEKQGDEYIIKEK